VVGQDWHYSYDSASDLTEIRDPNNAVLIHNNYAKPVVTSVDFNDQTIDDYDLTTHPNNPGTASIEDDGQTLHMVGDSWKKVSLPYDVTNRTILEFDFKSTNEGALHAIGFDKDDSVDWSQIFKLYGTDQLGNTDYNNYAAAAPGWKHYKIRLERIPHTSASSLVFINNDPSENATVESDFSNIKIYEETGSGRVTSQYNGNGQLVTSLEYNPDGETIITDALGHERSDTYNPTANVLMSQTDAMGGQTGKVFDANFKPTKITDANGHTTQLAWSEDGAT
jgi:hypothetical protein